MPPAFGDVRTSMAAIRLVRRLLIGSLVIGAAGCHTDSPLDWPPEPGVVQPPSPPTIRVEVDLYVDSTVSMMGFTRGTTSGLQELVSDLEAALKTGWRDVEVRYFRFGTVSEEAPREAIVSGMRQASFFTKPGLAERTNIDAVLGQSNPEHLTLILTDLFQDAGDVNAVVAALKDSLLVKGIAVGVLPVLSEFAGTVYDAKVPPYAYRSDSEDPSTYRPFYVLMFGDQQVMLRLVEVLSSRPNVDGNKFVLASSHVVQQQDVTVPRDTVSRNLVVPTVTRPATANQVQVDLRDGGEATLVVRAAVKTYQGIPSLRWDRIEATVQRLTESGFVETADLAVTGVVAPDADGQWISIPLSLRLGHGPGTWRQYRVELRTSPSDAFVTPAWVGDLHSSNPTPNADPNRTLNLEPFVRGLLQSTAAVHRPIVTRFYIDVRKR